MFYIKPNSEKKVEGKPLQVYDPQRRDFLPPEGRMLTPTSYWLRMLRCGDAVKVSPPATEAAAAPVETASEATAPKKSAKKK